MIPDYFKYVTSKFFARSIETLDWRTKRKCYVMTTTNNKMARQMPVIFSPSLFSRTPICQANGVCLKGDFSFLRFTSKRGRYSDEILEFLKLKHSGFLCNGVDERERYRVQKRSVNRNRTNRSSTDSNHVNLLVFRNCRHLRELVTLETLVLGLLAKLFTFLEEFFSYYQCTI